MLDGGKQGVDLGLAIIPGVLIITTAVMMLTFGPKDPTIGYQGLPYEGVAFLPWVGAKLEWLFKPLFGFTHAELIAFPMTSLGAVGAALGPRQISGAGHYYRQRNCRVYSDRNVLERLLKHSYRHA